MAKKVKTGDPAPTYVIVSAISTTAFQYRLNELSAEYCMTQYSHYDGVYTAVMYKTTIPCADAN